MAAADTPINNPNDDLLEVDEYASELAKSIRQADPPFTIGVYGEWGSGKTSLVNMARRHLRDDRPPLTFVEFTAWPHKTAQDLWRALILRIAQQLYEVPEPAPCPRDPSPPVATGFMASLGSWLQSEAFVLNDETPPPDPRRVRYESLVTRLNGTSYGGVGARAGGLELRQEASLIAVAKAVTSALGTVSPLIGALRGLFGLDEKIKVADLVQRQSNEATRSRLDSMDAFSDALQDLFTYHANTKGTRVCVFVDDLDRCMPDVALDLLEAIKVLLGGIKQCVFIVAADQTVIAQGLRARFALSTGEASERPSETLYVKKSQEYFEKIVQFGLQVPEPTPEVAHRFIAAQFPQWVPVSDLLETAIGTNPRRLKQQSGVLDYKIAIARHQEAARRRAAEPAAGPEPGWGQRLPLREKLVSAYCYGQESVGFIAALTAEPATYKATMGAVEEALPDLPKEPPDPAPAAVPPGPATDLYQYAARFGPLLALLKAEPRLSSGDPAEISALARFADVRPARGGALTSSDPIFVRIFERFSVVGGGSLDELFREDLTRMILVDLHHKELLDHLVELAESAEWPVVLTDLERRIEEPGRKSRMLMPPPAQAILGLVAKFPPTDDDADPRRLLLARPRFSAICREEVLAFHGIRRDLSRAHVTMSPAVYKKDEATLADKARLLAKNALDLMRQADKELVELAFRVRADATKDYLELRRFAKVQLLAYRWPQILACLSYARASVLDLEHRILQPTAASDPARGALDGFLNDDRLVRFLSLRPYLKDIYADEVAAATKVSAAAPPTPSAVEAVPAAAAAAAVATAAPAVALVYENVILELSETGNDVKATVHRGTRSKESKFTWRTGELEEIFGTLRTVALGQGTVGREPPGRVTDATVAIRDIGGRLFDRIVQGHGRALLLKALQDPTTRTRVMVQATEGNLSLVPWESLYVRELRTFLGLNEAYSLVRYMAPNRAAWPHRLDAPLRVLAVLPSPADVASLNLRGEAEMLRSGLAAAEESGWAQLTILDKDVTVARVSDAVATLRPHVLHFAGHALYDSNSKEGALVLGAAQAEPFLAVNVAEMLEGKGVMLAVLNGCDTGSSPSNDAITGVAGTLVRRGMPAVIATMREILDEAALAFTRNFYHSLLGEGTLESALLAARKGLSIEKWDWAAYALFTCVDDLERFKFSPSSASRSKDTPRNAGPPNPGPR